jgi:GPH family glycoside/pentoside/hexuronide:cation symporter
MMTAKKDRVPLRKKIAYAAPAYALAVVGIPVYVYIPKFYTDVVGINIAILGYLLFVALTMYLLFNPPLASPTFETVWFGVCIYTLFLFWTAVVVPFESLGPEVTFDYDERTSLFGLRDGFLIAGTLAAASSPAAVQWLFGLSGDDAGERAKFFWIAIIYAPLLIGTCWWCALAIRENRQNANTQTFGIWRGLRQVTRNRPFMILLIAYTVSAIGNNLPATLILFYVEYVLQSKLADGWLRCSSIPLHLSVCFFSAQGMQLFTAFWYFCPESVLAQPLRYLLQFRRMSSITMSF